jgi:hypothetical protein
MARGFFSEGLVMLDIESVNHVGIRIGDCSDPDRNVIELDAYGETGEEQGGYSEDP